MKSGICCENNHNRVECSILPKYAKYYPTDIALKLHIFIKIGGVHHALF